MLAAQPALLKSKISASLFKAITGSRQNGKMRMTHVPEVSAKAQRAPAIRAVISSDDKSIGTSLPSTGSNGSLSPSPASSVINLKAAITVRKKMKEGLTEKIEDQWESFINGIGKGIVIRLVSEEIDPDTRSGRSVESAVRGWLPKPSNHPYIVEYNADFTVQSDFGRPGAIIITNLHNKEFYLMEIVIHGFKEGPIFFPANSWIHSRNDSRESRIIFSNQAYLPSQTPVGIKDLRREDLISLRGNGKEERKKFDRIYDYAPYNDLGNPDNYDDLARPVLDGEKWPYPRRCRTGRPPTNSDPKSESRIEKPHPVYVPRDETFEEVKQATFSAGRLKSLFHNLIPSLAAALSNSDNPFRCFSEIDKLYTDGFVIKHDEQKQVLDSLLLPRIIRQVVSAGERLLKYETPAIISRDRFAWLRDSEFARQTLAGVNPVNIERLREFPIISKLDPAVYGPPASAITKECIEKELRGMTVKEAIENRRLFILDFHDLLLPFVNKINSLKGRKSYASRTVFFLNDRHILTPIAIELTLPPTPTTTQKKNVYTHGHHATTHWMWKLAKAHVCSNDAGVHQLVNHCEHCVKTIVGGGLEPALKSVISCRRIDGSDKSKQSDFGKVICKGGLRLKDRFPHVHA